MRLIHSPRRESTKFLTTNITVRNLASVKVWVARSSMAIACNRFWLTREFPTRSTQRKMTSQANQTQLISLPSRLKTHGETPTPSQQIQSSSLIDATKYTTSMTSTTRRGRRIMEIKRGTSIDMVRRPAVTLTLLVSSQKCIKWGTTTTKRGPINCTTGPQTFSEDL